MKGLGGALLGSMAATPVRRPRPGRVLAAISVLVVAAGLLPSAAPPVRAAGFFIVNSTGDTNEFDAALTLREAIIVGNGERTRAWSKEEQVQLGGCTFDEKGVITGGCGSGGDSIVFDVERIDLTSVLPTIAASGLAIDGKEGRPVIDARLVGSADPALTALGDGLRIDAPNVRIVGLSIVNVPAFGLTALAGIRVLGGPGVRVEANFLGTLPGATDCAPSSGGVAVTRNAAYGVAIGSAVTGTTTTRSATVAGNVIGCHGLAGVWLTGATHVLVGGEPTTDVPSNRIGVTATGAAIPNGNGILIDGGASSNDVWNNVIESNTGVGLRVSGSNGTSVQGNSLRRHGDTGVRLDAGASGNTIGGHRNEFTTGRRMRNVISANAREGIYIAGAATSGNAVVGNFIGTTADGRGADGNGRNGIVISEGAHDNDIGAGDADLNVISANRESGVVIDRGAHGNAVQDSVIGIGDDGAALGNAGVGVALASGAYANRVGPDTSAEHGNTIAANGGDGVWIAGAGTSGNVVDGNRIGVTAGGLARGNGGAGVAVESAGTANTIGPGPYTSRVQIIGANAGPGIRVATTDGTRIGDSNRIGTNDAGTRLGNGGPGILIRDSNGTFANPILVRFNGGAGAAVTGAGSRGNTIVPGSISDNAGLPIDLANDGRSINDPGDADSGPNTLLNYPTITSVSDGSVSGEVCGGCFVHLYRAGRDPARLGGGGAHVGIATADAAGRWTFTLPVGLSVADLSMVAADAAGNSSEMSSAGAIIREPRRLEIRDVSPNGLDPAGRGLYAGRVADAAIDPSTFRAADKRILAVSDAALWESTNTGRSWRRLTGLDRYGQFNHTSITFDPTDATGRRVFITTIADGQATPQHGVYRSTDGGRSWVPAIRRDARGTIDRDNHAPGCPATGVIALAIDPTNGQNVYAAGGCAIGYSHDGGATFQWTDPDPSNQGYNSVTVAPDGVAYACGANGIYGQRAGSAPRDRFDSLGTPPFPNSGPGNGGCDIAADPVSPGRLYIAGVWSGPIVPGANGCGQCTEIYEVDRTTSGGTARWTWRSLNGDPKPPNRPLVVQTRITGSKTFELYYGNGVSGEHLRCRRDRTPACPSGGRPFATPTFWKHVAWDGRQIAIHADPTVFLFDPTSTRGCLLLVGADGGLERPAPTNCDGTSAVGWTRASVGMHAHQPYEVTGTIGAEQTDLYLAMQDIAFLYSANGGSSWRANDATTQGDEGNDGFETAVDRVAPGRGASIRMIFRALVYTSRAGRFYSGAAQFGANVLPTGLMDIDWFRNRGYVAATRAGTTAQLMSSTDDGSTWTNVSGGVADGRGAVDANGWVEVTGTTANPVFYLRSAGRLRRINGLGAGARSVAADGSGVTAVMAFGVSRSDPTKLYAWDCNGGIPCTNGQVVRSTSSGATWTTDALATRLIGSDWFNNTYPLAGTRRFSGFWPVSDEAISFTFDPNDDRIVVLGTVHSGAFVTIDGGASWGRLPVITPIVTSAFFDDERGHFWFASYGRGVWEVRLGGTSLAVTSTRGTRGATVSWRARLRGMDGEPILGRRILFELVDASGTGRAFGSAVTDEDGLATASVPLTLPAGTYTLRARFGGDGSGASTRLLGTETERTYTVTGP